MELGDFKLIQHVNPKNQCLKEQIAKAIQANK